MLATHLPRLIIGALLGGFLALTYGWLIRPVEYIDTTPDSLRVDFRTDYVLMVAESYTADQDLDLALFRLAALGPLPPDEYATAAIDYALEQSFSRTDLEHLNQLAIALRALAQPSEIQAP
jgi:hypothetical protein